MSHAGDSLGGVAALLVVLAAACIDAAEASVTVKLSRRRAAAGAGAGDETTSHRCDTASLPTGHGGRCSFRVDEHTEYLPDPAFLNFTIGHPSAEWAREREAFREYVGRLQNPGDCSEPGKPWRLLTFRNAGLKANLEESAALSLWDAWMHGEAVVMSNVPWRYADDDEACGPGYNCLLKPLTRCRLEDIPAHNILVRAGAGCAGPPSSGAGGGGRAAIRRNCTLAEACRPLGAYNLTTGFCECPDGYGPEKGTCVPAAGPQDGYARFVVKLVKDRAKFKGLPNYKRGVHPGSAAGRDRWGFGRRAALGPPAPMRGFSPLRFGHRTGAVPLVLSELMGVPELLRLAEERRAAGRRCVAVQVRRGDACSRGRACPGVADYAAKVEAIVRLYGGALGGSWAQPAVFVATDDPAVIPEMEDALARLGLQARSLDIDRSKYAPLRPGLTMEINKRSAGTEFAREIILDVWEMALCDMFVGAMRSGPFKMAYELGVGMRGWFPPFISLDGTLGE